MEENKNGWKHLIKTIQYDIAVIKETMMNLDKKISEQMLKHEFLRERVEKMEDDIKKRQFQTFYTLLGAMLSFVAGLLLFILSLLRAR